MYIAIEGIKGSGKSTLINTLLQMNSKEIKRFELFPMTAPINHKYLKFNVTNPKNFHDSYIERMFIDRAYWHHKRLINKRGLILGDRSIATACVTRWNTWKDPYFTIERVKRQYNSIINLDVVIWLKTDFTIAEKQIAQRKKKSIRCCDEKSESLKTASEIYEELFCAKIFHKKISKIQVIELLNIDDKEALHNEFKSILNFYSKS